jgi:hypothetical protein
VNVLAAEGDLSPAPTGELQKLSFRVWSASGDRQSLIASRQSSDLSPVLLWLAAFAFAAELLLLAL